MILRSSRQRRRIAMSFAIAMTIVVTTIVINPMTNHLDIDSLDKKIQVTDYIALCALAATLVGAIFSFHYRKEQNELLKTQREYDQVTISQSNERSEAAHKEAALSNERASAAEVRSKELEVQLIKLRLATADRFIPANMATVLIATLKKHPNKKALILCAISNNNEPMQFSTRLGDLFASAGWQSEVQNQSNIAIPAPTGVVFTAVGNPNESITQLLFDQISSLGYECYKSIRESGPADIIVQVRAK